MSNPIMDLLGESGMQPQVPGNAFNMLRSFSQTLNGNPRDIVQRLMSSGKMSQAQFEQYGQMANSILKRK